MIAFAISTLSLIVVFITMMVRANDQRMRPGVRWHVRMIGLILAGCTPIGIIGVEAVTRDWPSFYDALFRLGLAFVFMTTPGQPPWHTLVWRGDEK